MTKRWVSHSYICVAPVSLTSLRLVIYSKMYYIEIEPTMHLDYH